MIARYHGKKNDYVIEGPAYKLGNFILSDKMNCLLLRIIYYCWMTHWCQNQIYLRSFMLQKEETRRSL